MKLPVEITQEKIDQATHMTCCSCPVALSINSEVTKPYPKIVNASVHKEDGHCTLESKKTEIVEGKQKMSIERMVHRFKLPAKAKEFVARWDACQNVNPISFELELVYSHPLTTGRCTI